MFSIQPLYSITIYYCFYPISFIRFFAYINHTYIVYFAEVSGFFISAFISIYSLNTLFTEINSSCLIYESIKALEIRTSIVSNLPFPSKIFCYASSFFFLDNWLILFDSCIYYTNFYCCSRTCNTNRNTN